MGFILFVGVGLGFAASVVATFLLSPRVIATMVARGPGTPERRRTIVKGAVAGAVIALGPALLLGTVIGATLGGTYGGDLGAMAGARDSGAMAGVALGVFAVATIVLIASIAIGAWAGRWIADRDHAET